MAATKGNQFWKQRSRHGRDKIFASPLIMLRAAEKYFTWCDNNPIIETQFFNRGKYGVQSVEVPHMRPYTITALCIYLGVNTRYFNDFKKRLDLNKKIDKDFSTVITRIEEIIYSQKFQGAAAGFFNANIIARDLGLTDKKEIEANHNIKGLNFLNPNKK